MKIYDRMLFIFEACNCIEKENDGYE